MKRKRLRLKTIPEVEPSPAILIVLSTTTSFNKVKAEEVAKWLSYGVVSAGGRPSTINIPLHLEDLKNSTDFGLSFVLKDIISDYIEMMILNNKVDGVAVISDDFISSVGIMLGCFKRNIPLVYLFAGDVDGNLNDNVRFGILQEILGISMPNSCLEHNLSEKNKYAYQTGKKLIELIKTQTTPRKLLLRNNFHNVFVVDLALGGCPLMMTQYIAIGIIIGEVGLLDIYKSLLSDVPVLVPLEKRICDSSELKSLKEFRQAGGVYGLMNQLKTLLKPASNIADKNLHELTKNVSGKINKGIIFSLKNPYLETSNIFFFNGNLAQGGCFVRIIKHPKKERVFTYNCKTFDSEDLAIEYLNSSKSLQETFLVVKYAGAKSGNGLRKLSNLPDLINKLHLGNKIVLATDGFLDKYIDGINIELISPDSSSKSVFSIIENNDTVILDLNSNQISLKLQTSLIEVRLAKWRHQGSQFKSDTLVRYTNQVSPIFEGALVK